MKYILSLCFLIFTLASANTTEKKNPKNKNNNRNKSALQPIESIVENDPYFAFPTIVARTTDKSTIINIAPKQAMEVYVEYGPEDSKYNSQTKAMKVTPSAVFEIELKNLKPNTRYFYRVRFKAPGEKEPKSYPEYSFMTQRSPGSTFTFAVQGDSHPERPHQFTPQLYQQVMNSVIADKPDFYFTIGDDFSVAKVEKTLEGVEGMYQYQRQFLGQIGRYSPLFLVNGNHEHAAKYILDGTPDNLGVWGQNSRNKFFSQPEPDNFYSGNTEKVDHIGYLRDYYSWEWGDALFVVIDPYWHSDVPVDGGLDRNKGKNRDLWNITLGEKQYRWLSSTLANSKAKYKFVFTHHILGTGRGGTESAALYEWGGRNRKGQWEFSEKRPGWELPIHQLMKKNNVTVFFQGHDHIYVKQELDGIVYQSLPSPADPSGILHNADAYKSEAKFIGPGHVRVTVSPDKVKVDYIKVSGEIIHTYTIPSK